MFITNSAITKYIDEPVRSFKSDDFDLNFNIISNITPKNRGNRIIDQNKNLCYFRQTLTDESGDYYRHRLKRHRVIRNILDSRFIGNEIDTVYRDFPSGDISALGKSRTYAYNTYKMDRVIETVPNSLKIIDLASNTCLFFTDIWNQTIEYINPILSPDGNWFAYIEKTVNLDENKISLNLYRLNVKASVSDITNWNKFVQELSDHKKTEINYLWNKLDKPVKNLVNKARTGHELSSKEKQEIVNGLNRFICSFMSLPDNNLFFDSKESRNIMFYCRLTDFYYNSLATAHLVLHRSFSKGVFASKRNNIVIFPYIPLKYSDSEKIYPLKKCWSPDSKYLLYFNIIDGKFSVFGFCPDANLPFRFFDTGISNDNSPNFNPMLEWTEDGIVITCRDAIFAARKMDYNNFIIEKIKPKKVTLPKELCDFTQGRLSEEGKYLMFIGRKRLPETGEKSPAFLFVYEFDNSKIFECELPKKDPELYQAAWVKKGKRSVLSEEYDYFNK
jgi:hypothetical protein